MNKQGFTLVEILFAVALIGLLAAIGIPSILGAHQRAVNRLAETNILIIEKAKKMLQLPAVIYDGGQSVPVGTPYGEGNYTESNLMACIQNKVSLEEFHFINQRLVPGVMGERARYEDIPEEADVD